MPPKQTKRKLTKDHEALTALAIDARLKGAPLYTFPQPPITDRDGKLIRAQPMALTVCPECDKSGELVRVAGERKDDPVRHLSCRACGATCELVDVTHEGDREPKYVLNQVAPAGGAAQ